MFTCEYFVMLFMSNFYIQSPGKANLHQHPYQAWAPPTTPTTPTTIVVVASRYLSVLAGTWLNNSITATGSAHWLSLIIVLCKLLYCTLYDIKMRLCLYVGPKVQKSTVDKESWFPMTENKQHLSASKRLSKCIPGPHSLDEWWGEGSTESRRSCFLVRRQGKI